MGFERNISPLAFDSVGGDAAVCALNNDGGFDGDIPTIGRTSSIRCDVAFGIQKNSIAAIDSDISAIPLSCLSPNRRGSGQVKLVRLELNIACIPSAIAPHQNLPPRLQRNPIGHYSDRPGIANAHRCCRQNSPLIDGQNSGLHRQITAAAGRSALGSSDCQGLPRRRANPTWN